MVIAGFDFQRVPVADGVALHVAVGGSGDPIVLLHGFPQTHLMWRHVARELADHHTVICPDLRGYGASDKPADPAGTAYAKRTMAADVVALARALGHERFALAGHDRGALVAFRAGLDHPEAVTHLACLDVLPTLDMWDAMHGTSAAGRVLPMPVTVLQQDWGAALGFDAAALWRPWAPNLHHQTVGHGHFMAEEAPAEIAQALRDLLAR